MILYESKKTLSAAQHKSVEAGKNNQLHIPFNREIYVVVAWAVVL